MKASKVFVSILSVYFIAALSLIIVQSAGAVYNGNVTISDGGGDCTSVGTWNATTKTCTLKDDIDLTGVGGNGVTIADDGITLVCNGHLITGNGSGYGIDVEERSGVSISKCNVTNFARGINLSNSNSNTVNGNAAYSNPGTGIVLQNSNSNTVNGNTANSNGNGIFLQNSDSNTVNGNTANSNGAGIVLFSSDSNTVNNNTANENFDYGFYQDGGNSNTVNNNTADENGSIGFYQQAGTPTNSTFKHDECSGNGKAGSLPSGLCSPQQ